MKHFAFFRPERPVVPPVAIPAHYSPEFLEALTILAKEHQEANRANPVSTYNSSAMQLRFEQCQREGARLQAIILAASTLSEPWAHDIDAIEEAIAELDGWLDEDSGQLERAAHAKVRSNKARGHATQDRKAG